MKEGDKLYCIKDYFDHNFTNIPLFEKGKDYEIRIIDGNTIEVYNFTYGYSAEYYLVEIDNGVPKNIYTPKSFYEYFDTKIERAKKIIKNYGSR